MQEGGGHVQRLQGWNELGLSQEAKGEASGCSHDGERVWGWGVWVGSEHRELSGHERNFGFLSGGLKMALTCLSGAATRAGVDVFVIKLFILR